LIIKKNKKIVFIYGLMIAYTQSILTY